MARVVFDTNVYLPVIAIGRGSRFDLLMHCWDHHQVYVSRAILTEVRRILLSKFHLPQADVSAAIQYCQGFATLVKPATVPTDACRDPDDLVVLGTVRAAQADVLISGDRDLLDLEHFDQTPIISPADFWQWEAHHRGS
ncbi:MAG: putative toxin-antitoxin system toxin component, PIN family [Planctomycetota bacterium]|nr:MAG: putative toxin-antitoxin system toxin component, PIN family [Planctomycetota bacterium]